MGTEYLYQCHKCLYLHNSFEGVGFAYPYVYHEVMEDIRNGKYGEKYSKYIQEHPDAAVDASEVLFKCEHCGEFVTAPELSIYLPKPGYHAPKNDAAWSVEVPCYSMDYVDNSDLKQREGEKARPRNYDFIFRIEQRCEKCNSPLVLVDTSDETKIRCPKCGMYLKRDDIGDWD